MEFGCYLKATVYFEKLRWREGMARSTAETHTGVDVLLKPTTSIPDLPLDVVHSLDGDGTEDYDGGLAEQYTRNVSIGNMLGLCAVTLPRRFTVAGLPIGLQVYAKPFPEDVALRLPMPTSRRPTSTSAHQISRE